MSDLYHALAAPARRAILDELRDRDGQTLFEICTCLIMKHDLEMSRQAVTQHLEVLEAAGLVISRREGRHRVHNLNLKPLEAIARRWPTTGRETSDADRGNECTGG